MAPARHPHAPACAAQGRVGFLVWRFPGEMSPDSTGILAGRWVAPANESAGELPIHNWANWRAAKHELCLRPPPPPPPSPPNPTPPAQVEPVQHAEASLPPEMERVMRFSDGPGAVPEHEEPNLLLRLWRYQGP
jgi:hypothetical protein